MRFPSSGGINRTPEDNHNLFYSVQLPPVLNLSDVKCWLIVSLTSFISHHFVSLCLHKLRMYTSICPGIPSPSSSLEPDWWTFILLVDRCYESFRQIVFILKQLIRNMLVQLSRACNRNLYITMRSLGWLPQLWSYMSFWYC